MRLLLYALLLFPLLSSASGGGMVDLGGVWKFTVDPGDEGIAGKWFATGFDDSSWNELETGKGWPQQGVEHSGFGWFRRQVTIPETYKGVPMTLVFGEILYDDEVWFNGERVGGLQGPYKFRNIAKREYAVPSSLIRYGEPNAIAVRTWGMRGTGTEGDRFGLAQGPFQAVFDPYAPMMKRTGVNDTEEVLPQMFDLSDARQGMTFEIVVRQDPELFGGQPGSVSCVVTDFYDNLLRQDSVSVTLQCGEAARAAIPVDRELARKIYFAGRFKVRLTWLDSGGSTVAEQTLPIDRLSFSGRDATPLPDKFAGQWHETPYGRLRLVDVIDCAADVASGEHPYMESGFDPRQQYQTPGSPVKVQVREILGREARESEVGWFAYRVGRGKLTTGKPYLLRIEYPEDKPRYSAVSIHTGENYADIGFRSGVSADNPYDPWPLSGKWEWYDVVVTPDGRTPSTSGANGASSEHGIWVYFLNKAKHPVYFPFYEGGPAVARVMLYEMDAQKDAPVIRRPEGLPERTLMFDWERQPLADPDNVALYARMMGYNAVAPVVMKWVVMNYGDPLEGYNSYNSDRQGYWDRLDWSVEKGAREAIPGRISIHRGFLEATKKYGIGYVPRIEYGGSQLLPQDARAIGADGKPAKPNRFADWCGNLLHPAVYDDFSRLLEFFVGDNLKEFPQLKGILWRIRCDRMPISYGRDDVAMFCTQTETVMPTGTTDEELAVWASSGDIADRYTDWWHEKRAEFHTKVARLMASYRPGLQVYFYNWDNDKMSLGMNDFTGWDFLGEADALAKNDPQAAVQFYRDNLARRREFSSGDYIRMMYTGDLGVKKMGYLPHHGIRPGLYREENFQILAPGNALYEVDDERFMEFFKTPAGLAVSNPIVYDETFARFPNPKYEANTTTPGGAAFSMAMELLPYFHGDARTLTFTSYTYSRGFAAAHRRFAQAFLALPAVEGEVVPGTDGDVRVRTYKTPNGIYVGVACKGHTDKSIRVTVPDVFGRNTKEVTITDLVTGGEVMASKSGTSLRFTVNSAPMQLNAYLIKQKQ